MRYRSLFEREQDVQLSIPNTVTPKYTGVLHVTVRFDFYAGGPVVDAAVLALLPLRDPWTTLAATRGLKATVPPLPPTKRLWLDLYASSGMYTAPDPIRVPGADL